MEAITWRVLFNWLPKLSNELIPSWREQGRSKDFFLKEIIKRGLEDVEDYYLAAEVLERVREGTEAVYSDAEVR